MSLPHFTPDAPYWHRAAPLEPPEDGPLPERVETVVIGAGFTGLGCALALAKAGREVLVLDAGSPGQGASSRNGGMIGWGHRADRDVLAKRYGEEAADGIVSLGPRSLAFLLNLIEREGIECDLQRTGRFLGAASPKHFDRIARQAETIFAPAGVRCRVVPKDEQGTEIATDSYVGGVLFEDHGAVHPAKLHAGMLAAARRAGARVEGKALVAGLRGGPGGWTVETPRGLVGADEVAFAANGYAARFSSALRSLAARLLPLPSFIVATEALGENRMKALMPGGRCYVDTRSSHSYYRPSPDGTRILWGGRASLTPIPEDQARERLRQHMLGIFPSLEDVALEEAWTGLIAYTRDGIPHVGRIDGLWYAGGYCGSGVAMAPFLGWQMGRRIAGLPDEAGCLDATAPARWPPYRGAPWFMRGVEAYYRWKDRRDGVIAPVR